VINRREWLHQLGLALSAFAQPKSALVVPSSNEKPKPQANNKKPALALADYEPRSMLHAHDERGTGVTDQNMNSPYCRSLFLILTLVLASWRSASAAQATIKSVWAKADVALDTNPTSDFWRAAQAVYMETGPHGNPVPKYRTEVRTRWTSQNLYFLFVCPYEQLNLKPNPKTSTETYELWNWDVAEVFVGSDFKDIKRYKEFEVSPQGEWIDLDIDLHKPHHEEGWTWNSGFQVSARIDRAAQVWYGAMRIPYSAIDTRPAAGGNILRVNLLRSQGPGPNRHEITWQAPMADTFHIPERFGLLELTKKN
jgi:Carbohydrate family 9 binding domain-like